MDSTSAGEDIVAKDGETPASSHGNKNGTGSCDGSRRDRRGGSRRQGSGSIERHRKGDIKDPDKLGMGAERRRDHRDRKPSEKKGRRSGRDRR